MIARLPALAFLLIALPAAAEPPRTPVSDARPLLVAAIDAADGTAHGVLVGEVAQAITQRFAATSPIYIDVTTLKRYAEPGCRRLNVKFWQEGVRLPGVASPRRQTLDFGLDYCADGQAPRSREVARP